MQRELKKEDLAKLYREFSRQKYNKYRHQFPRMRESQLVSKIIKEWEALGTQEKEQLYDSYITEKHITDERSESSEAQQSKKKKKPSPGSSSVGKGKKDQSSSKGPGVPSGTPSKREEGVRVWIQSSSSKKHKAQSQSSDFARDGAKKDFQISESVSKQIGTKVGKKKRITKIDRPKTEYLKFFKFYYDKLSLEHKRWSASQISTIIKLLWKKKLVSDKSAAKSGFRVPIARRKVSGRMAFRRAYSYSGIEGAERWKQLPIESKKYWRSKGEGLKSGERRVVKPSITDRRLQRKGSSESSDISKHLKFFRSTIVA